MIIEIPQGAKKLTLKDGFEIEVPEGAKTLEIPDNLLIPEQKEKKQESQKVDLNEEFADALNNPDILNRKITPPKNNEAYNKLVQEDKPLETEIVPVVDTFVSEAIDDLAGDETEKKEKSTEVLSHIQNVQFANKDLLDMIKGFSGDKEALKTIQNKAMQTNKAVADTLYSLGFDGVVVDGDGEVKFKDDDGSLKVVGDSFWEGLKEDIANNKFEIAGDILGGIAGNRVTKKYLDSVPSGVKLGGWRGKVAEFLGTLGGAALGSFAGRATDVENSKSQLLNMVDDLQKATNLKDVIEQNPTLQKALDGANMTIYGTAITSAIIEPVIKVGGQTIKLTKEVKDYIANGNINGAREILKKDLKISEKYIDDALEQATKSYKETEEYASKGITGKAKQQEELLAATLEKGDANIIKGAITNNETAARNLSDTIDQRAINVQDELDTKSSKIGGEEIKNYLNTYEQSVKSDFNNMRKDFSEAFKEVDYKFELEDLNLDSVFRDMAKRVQDPDAKKRFLTLQTSIKNTIYNSNAYVGIERDIDGLLDLRQQLNNFYRKNEKYLSNKKDKENFASLKENLDNQIYKAVNDKLPDDIATRLIDSFSKSMGKYRELGALSENKVFKGIMGDASKPEYRMEQLIKHMADDDSYVDDVLSKMPPNARQSVEVAVIRDIADSFTAKTAEGQKAIAFEDLGKELESIKRNVRSELGKETIENLIGYADKFGNKDLLYLDMAKGIITKPKHNISTTLDGKIKTETANMFFQFLQSIKPGDDAKRLALQRHIGKALERSRTPKEFATKVYEYPELPDDSRNVLKTLIKQNNKIEMAKNEAEKQKTLIKAIEEKDKALSVQEKINDEIENFKTPSIHEIRAVETHTSDDKFGSFSQMTVKIARGTATPNEIETYVKAKNEIDPEVLEKTKLKNQYPVNSTAIDKLEELKSFDSVKVNEVLNDNEYKALVRGLKDNKLPNTTKEMEEKYRQKFYELNKLYDEVKDDISTARKTKDNLILGKNRLIENDAVNNYLDNDFDIYRHLPYTDENWVKEFKLNTKDDTAIVKDILGNEVKISKEQANKIEKNNRGHYFGLIKPTIENPTMILKHKDAEVYIKRFYDEEMKKYSIYSVTKDYGSNEVYLSSVVHRRDNQLVNKIREGEVTYLNHGTVNGTPSSRATSPIQSTESLSEDIITNNLEKNNIEESEKIIAKDEPFDNMTFEEAQKAGLIPFAKFGDNLLAGTIAGVETDEDGNITGFDPEAFVVGLGGYTVAKQSAKYIWKQYGDKIQSAAGKKIAKFIEDTEEEMAKMAGGGKPPVIAGAVDDQGFYSVLEKVVDEKVGEKIDTISLTKMLEKNGVKQDEIEWSGLKELMDSNEKLTHEQIENTLKENRLVIEKMEKDWKLYDKKRAEINDPTNAELDEIDNTKPKYGEYKLDGGNNYKEYLLRTPKVDGDYKSQHWDESNIIVFTRVDDRTIDDKKTLFIEELQSDWHQEGRKHGYKPSENEIKQAQKRLEELIKDSQDISKEFGRKEAQEMNNLEVMLNGRAKIPNAPFKKNWAELGMKRMIQEAVANDYDKIAWTTGKQQAKRYSLDKELDTIVYNKQTGYIQGSKGGDEVVFKKVASDEEVEAMLGKELTKRLIDPKSSTTDEIYVLQGDELKFGGDGMKAFYDNIVPNIAKKLFKKYKVKPKMEELDELEEMVWSVDITPQMKEDIKNYGQPLYMVGGTMVGLEAMNNNSNGDENER
jgi:hypothetical protein